ncbi:MAG: ECF-type sigma factor [Planctomycetota bacterium]|nr:ECF-type sigma factor [Planctomycetota bacterium]
MEPRDQHVTALLDRIREGDTAATGELLNAAYCDLRAMASNLFGGESPAHTLQPTALVNELCIRLLRTPQNGWTDRNHFFKVAARAMRHLLTDHARARVTQRRGGSARKVSLDSLQLSAPDESFDLLALDETITGLAKFNERLAQIFELRFLAGLTVEQTAVVVELSPRAVEKDCRFIRAWLQRELEP